MGLHGDYDLDLSFQRGCGQNIERTRVIYCLHLFSLGYKFTVGLSGWGVKENVTGWLVIPEMKRANDDNGRGLAFAARTRSQRAKRGPGVNMSAGFYFSLQFPVSVRHYLEP